ncbi:hypothetical protein [Arundinibacter roseus]|uniref:Uncharacterized protein n=1 Tax=Arundinibacter roseus TaxID=2070510 RepID=A0A4R4KK58_9BACT|nr:hypothetical protein [Arundinibacter roseus]TDB66961.1 hypothetical protein EZE20_07535 [Arundinibacter roseus]
MRYVKDMPHSQYKISLYQWNGKYIIKFEAGRMFEQIYKIDETDLGGIEDIDALLDSTFVSSVTERFGTMFQDFQESMERNNLLF